MSTAALLKELEKLPYEKLVRLVPQVLALRAKKRPEAMPAREAVLVRKITGGAPAKQQGEYRLLTEKRRKSGLSSEEQGRLVSITDALEAFNVRWLGWVSELAGRQGKTTRQVINDLHLPSRPYV